MNDFNFDLELGSLDLAFDIELAELVFDLPELLFDLDLGFDFVLDETGFDLDNLTIELMDVT